MALQEGIGEQRAGSAVLIRFRRPPENGEGDQGQQRFSGWTPCNSWAGSEVVPITPPWAGLTSSGTDLAGTIQNLPGCRYESPRSPCKASWV